MSNSGQDSIIGQQSEQDCIDGRRAGGGPHKMEHSYPTNGLAHRPYPFLRNFLKFMYIGPFNGYIACTTPR